MVINYNSLTCNLLRNFRKVVVGCAVEGERSAAPARGPPLQQVVGLRVACVDTTPGPLSGRCSCTHARHVEAVSSQPPPPRYSTALRTAFYTVRLFLLLESLDLRPITTPDVSTTLFSNSVMYIFFSYSPSTLTFAYFTCFAISFLT